MQIRRLQAQALTCFDVHVILKKKDVTARDYKGRLVETQPCSVGIARI